MIKLGKKAKSSNTWHKASSCSASPKRRKGSAYQLETDSEADDFLVRKNGGRGESGGLRENYDGSHG